MISSEILVSGYDAFTEDGGSVSSREKASFGKFGFCPVLWALPCCAALGSSGVTWSLCTRLQWTLIAEGYFSETPERLSKPDILIYC